MVRTLPGEPPGRPGPSEVKRQKAWVDTPDIVRAFVCVSPCFSVVSSGFVWSVNVPSVSALELGRQETSPHARAGAERKQEDRLPPEAIHKMSLHCFNTSDI